MKRTVLFSLLAIAVLVIAVAAMPPPARAWGPCDGMYGGYAGCNYFAGMYGGYYGGYCGDYCGGYFMNNYTMRMYSTGFTYNRVCRYGANGQLYCTYVRVPAYPASGYYPYYSNYGGW